MLQGQSLLLNTILVVSDYLQTSIAYEERQSHSLQKKYTHRMDRPSDANLDTEVAKQFATDIGTNKTQLELASFVQNLAPFLHWRLDNLFGYFKLPRLGLLVI